MKNLAVAFLNSIKNDRYEYDSFLKDLSPEKLKYFQLEQRSTEFYSSVNCLRAECHKFSKYY